MGDQGLVLETSYIVNKIESKTSKLFSFLKYLPNTFYVLLIFIFAPMVTFVSPVAPLFGAMTFKTMLVTVDNWTKWELFVVGVGSAGLVLFPSLLLDKDERLELTLEAETALLSIAFLHE